MDSLIQKVNIILNSSNIQYIDQILYENENSSVITLWRRAELSSQSENNIIKFYHIFSNNIKLILVDTLYNEYELEYKTNYYNSSVNLEISFIIEDESYMCKHISTYSQSE